jgi:adenylate cyclase
MPTPPDSLPRLTLPTIGPAGALEIPTGAAPARILIADDDPDARDILVRLVERRGHAATQVADGRQAVEALGGGAYDLLLLDIMMPEMDGYQVLEAIRDDPELTRASVIVVSAVDDMNSVARCIEAGAADFLLKPFNSTLLNARLTACLEQKRLRDVARSAHAALVAEREQQRRLLLNMLPEPVSRRLLAGDHTVIGEVFPDATVLFANIDEFTATTAGWPPLEVVETLNRFFSAFDRLTERAGLSRIKTIGDVYVAAAGVPTPHPDHVAAAAELALAMQGEIKRVPVRGGHSFSLRVGMHCGPVVAGVIGTAKFTYDVWGDTVATATQIEAFGVEGAIQVSDAVRARLDDRYTFQHRGTFYLPRLGDVDTHILTGRRNP